MESKDKVLDYLKFSSRCLDEINGGVKKSGEVLKNLSTLKNQTLEDYKNSEISYETFRVLGKILNNTIDVIETSVWYLLD